MTARLRSIASLVSGFPRNDFVTDLLSPETITSPLEHDRFAAIRANWNAGFVVHDVFHPEYILLIDLNRLATDWAYDHSPFP
jgi:hypothetical protein